MNLYFFRSLLIAGFCLLAGCASMGRFGIFSNASLPTPLVEQPQKVALLLPLRGTYANSAQAIRNGFLAAYYNDKQRNPNIPTVTVLDTSGKDIRAIYQQAIAEGANFVVGPLTKPQVAELARSNLPVPTLALNSLDGQRHPAHNLFFFSLSPLDEAEQVAQKAWQDGHHNAIVIAQAGPWGQSIAQTFINRWQRLDGQVVGTLAFSRQQDLSSTIGNLLGVDKKIVSSEGFKEAMEDKIPLTDLRRQDFDMVYIVATPQQGRLIKPLLKFYFAEDIPVYSTSSIYSGVPAPQYDNDLNGIIFADMPWVLDNPAQLSPGMSAVQSSIMSMWPNSYANYSKLYAFGVDAYNLVDDLNRLISSPQVGIPGVTGTLYLGPKHQIFRQLEWAQIRDGVPTPL